MLTVRTDGRIVEADPEAARVLGASPDELVGETLVRRFVRDSGAFLRLLERTERHARGARAGIVRGVWTTVELMGPRGRPSRCMVRVAPRGDGTLTVDLSQAS